MALVAGVVPEVCDPSELPLDGCHCGIDLLLIGDVAHDRQCLGSWDLLQSLLCCLQWLRRGIQEHDVSPLALEQSRTRTTEIARRTSDHHHLPRKSALPSLSTNGMVGTARTLSCTPSHCSCGRHGAAEECRTQTSGAVYSSECQAGGLPASPYTSDRKLHATHARPGEGSGT